VLTALGSPPPDTLNEDTSPLLNAIGLLAGGVALGVGISLMSAYFTRLNTMDTTVRRARRLRHHVVVLGLGDVGLRVVQLLDRLGVPCAVVDTATDAESVRRRAQIGLVPVVPADLESGLPNAGVARAFSLIATSSDNLLNVEACLRAKREARQRTRTIARIFDDIPGFGAVVFGVDEQIAAASVAAPAFVDAALHEERVRRIDFPDWPMTALRWPSGHPVGSRRLRHWHAQGVRLLAIWRDGRAARPDANDPRIDATQEAILVGPEAVMEQVLKELRAGPEQPVLAAAA
jgi:Trk K+ transport system NAD-binding subunit